MIGCSAEQVWPSEWKTFIFRKIDLIEVYIPSSLGARPIPVPVDRLAGR